MMFALKGFPLDEYVWKVDCLKDVNERTPLRLKGIRVCLATAHFADRPKTGLETFK